MRKSQCFSPKRLTHFEVFAVSSLIIGIYKAKTLYHSLKKNCITATVWDNQGAKLNMNLTRSHSTIHGSIIYFQDGLDQNFLLIYKKTSVFYLFRKEPFRVSGRNMTKVMFY